MTSSSSAISPPAEFAISGTAFASASPEALAKILDTLDLASLEQEHARLERAIQQLAQSNKEIAEFIEQEQQDLIEFQKNQSGGGGGGDTSGEGFEPDPEFVLAIEENKVVIAKYERTCADLLNAIQRKRGTVAEEVKEVDDRGEQTGADDGVYL